MNELSTILSGFSAVSCIILCVVYVVSLPDMKKTRSGKLACLVLMLSLAAIQTAHVFYFTRGADLLGLRAYILLLGIVPVGFYFMARELLRLCTGFKKQDLLHLPILLIVLFLPIKVAVLTAFISGCFYTLYIFLKTLRLRTHIPRYRFEKFFFTLFFLMNLLALALGLSIQFLIPDFFYHAYAGVISIAMILVVISLLIFPELLSDVLLASETVYSKSKLENINVHSIRERLEKLMVVDRLFEDENLTLSSVAGALDITAQQLSELVNSSFSMGFPRYIRSHRIQAAKNMLLREPDASVLSISLATGFKSQSSFYTAFKEMADCTPAAFRQSSSRQE